MNNEFRTINGTTLDYKNNSILDIITSKYKEVFTPSDITVCIAVRLTEINPWVLPNLKLLLSHYSPRPNFLILDFGSQGEFKQAIENICNENNAIYIYHNDTGTFSLGLARNIGAYHVKTKFIFFSDVDCVFDSNIFGKLSKLINSLNIHIAPRRCIFLPVYHLTETSTKQYLDIDQAYKKDEYLDMLSFEKIGTKFGEYFSLVAPYSNIFLITKDFFNLSGGYCNLFRGHGSEDFEYLIRLGILSSNIPIPNTLNKDFYGPLKESFWYSQTDYSGFRKYLEALTISSELNGLKAFHLYHIAPSEKGYWTQYNDWKRSNFNKIINSYYPNVENILLQDYIERKQKALCIFSDKMQWGYFIPIRLYGYKIDILCSSNDMDIYNTIDKIEKKYYDRIFIFNPYMMSHAKYRGIIEISRKLCIKVTVIERGGFPNSLYYADEVVYGDKEYHNIDTNLSRYTPKNIEKTQSFINKLREGNSFLENQENYRLTYSKNVILRHSKLPTVFVPLQIEDDMAVTKFTEGYPSYKEFITQLQESISNNHNIIFVIKRHPLSKMDLSHFTSGNVIIIDNNANIHAIIDICKFTIVYNSGVGLISCIHQKPTFNIGNAYYSASNSLSNRVSSVEDAIKKLKSNQYHTTSSHDLIIFTDWLINNKYSWFNANDIIREFTDRKSHGYSNIMIELINLDNISMNIGASRKLSDIAPKSYLNHKITIYPKISGNTNNKEKIDIKSNRWRLIRKFRKDPYQYCADSKYKLIRVCRIFFSKKGNKNGK